MNTRFSVAIKAIVLSFMLSLPAAADQLFAVIGDFGDGSSRAAQVSGLVAGWNPDVIITTGDNRYPEAPGYDQAVGQFYCNFITDAQSGAFCGGNNSATNAFFPSVGNHDYDDGNGLIEYLDYFNLPGASIPGSNSSNSELYYDFVVGSVHFFSIDSQAAKNSSSSQTEQKNWLQAQLAASTAPWQIVFMHHPPFSSSTASGGSAPAVQWPFAAWGADAVLAGHAHSYERLSIDGIPHFINGVGGVTLSGFGLPAGGSIMRYSGANGAMRVQANETEITYELVNSQGVVIDTFTDVAGDIPGYCEAGASSQEYENIARVQVEDLDNPSGVAVYSDFTNLSASLTAGASASVSLTPGFSGSAYTEYWKIWIDYNNDLDFDDTGELVYSGSGSSTVNGSFNVPASAEGVNTRMRVSMKYNTTGTACGIMTFGEIEDYSVQISGATTQSPIADFSASTTAVNVGSPVQFTDLSSSLPTSWAWSFEGGTPALSTEQDPTVSYDTAGTYEVSLTASNSSGSDSETKSAFIEVVASGQAPVADFSASVTSVGAGGSVQFSDLSTGTPTSWAWSFTGGTPATSANQNPTVSYATAGTYAVSLTATNADGSGSETKSAFIEVVTQGQAPVADFSASVTAVNAGDSVQFGDLSTGTPTSWAWSFSGGTPATSANQNPTVSYATAGTYAVSLTATNGFGSNAITKSAFITVSATPLAYCSASGNSQQYENIARVQVADLDNPSGVSSYSDFTNLTASLTAGATTSVSLTPAFAGSATPEFWKIWIDYNNDLDFLDPGELAYSGSGSSVVNGSFIVPASAEGIITRMRVSMKYNATATACGTISYGEVEDYSVQISGSTPQPPAANFSASATIVNVGGAVQFTDLSSNQPTSWAWSFTGGTPATSTDQNPTVSYATAGNYEVALTATNAVGSDAETKSAFITVAETPLAYCSASGNSQQYENIARVQVADLDNPSGVSSYSDFTSLTASLTAGATTSVSLTPAFPGSVSLEFWKIWIDYNNDLDFDDAGELAYSGSGSSVVNGSFVVPANAEGITTRMRVSMKYNATAAACGTISYGEVEDYSVQISGATLQAPVADFSANVTSVNAGESVQFNDLSSETPTSWAWTFTGGTPASSTVQNPAVSYATAGTYAVSLTATNAGGSNTITKTAFIEVIAQGPAPLADFSASVTSVNVGDLVQFNDLSSEAPTSWTWTFIGGTPATSTVQNPAVSYATAGTYAVSLTATNANGSNTVTKSAFITVSGTALAYCSASASSQQYEYISRVQVGDLNKPSLNSTYSNFTSLVASLTAGASTNVTLTPTHPSTVAAEGWRIWIDFNRDGDFVDTGELVFSGTGTSAVTGSFVVPNSAALGSTRMRVSMKWQTAATSPCGSFGNGEVEDYTVLISAGSVQSSVADFSANVTSVNTGESVQFNDLSSETPTSWAWTFTGGTPASSADQNPTVSYATAGTYAVSLTATNAGGSNSITKSAFITVSESPLAYCSASANSQEYEYITRIQVADLDNPSGASSYSDFTGLIASLTAGASASVSLTPASGSPEFWKIWIDYNNDLDFDDTGELAYSGSGSSVVNGSFDVPASAAGITTRMRVSMKYNATATACGTISYGEVEDYSVQISGATLQVPVADFSANVTSVNVGEPVQFNDLSSETPTSWAWTFTGGTQASSADQNPAVSYATAGTYTVSLTATNADGSNTITKSAFIEVLAQGVAPVADFSANVTSVNAGGSVQFSDLSSETPTSWAWTFTGGTPASSAVQNPTVSYATAGNYAVSLTATNAGGSNTITNSAFITVAGAPVAYCSASASSQQYEYISRVQVGDLNKPSLNSTYSNFTSLVASLTAGASTNVTLTPTHPTTVAAEGWRIWIDYNRDGDFVDTGELVFSGTGTSAVTGSFVVPNSAPLGSTRMRVSMKWQTAANSPCGSFGNGEVEDYSVQISAGT